MKMNSVKFNSRPSIRFDMFRFGRCLRSSWVSFPPSLWSTVRPHHALALRLSTSDLCCTESNQIYLGRLSQLCREASEAMRSSSIWRLLLFHHFPKSAVGVFFDSDFDFKEHCKTLHTILINTPLKIDGPRLQWPRYTFSKPANPNPEVLLLLSEDPFLGENTPKFLMTADKAREWQLERYRARTSNCCYFIHFPPSGRKLTFPLTLT